MKIKIIAAAIVFLMAFLTGCASLKPIPLKEEFWQEKGKRVGVALVVLPPAEISVNAPPTPMFYGEHPFMSDGSMWDYTEYTDQQLRMAETKTIRDASKELNAREFVVVQDLFVQGLKDKGFAAFPVDNRIDPKAMPDFKGGSGDAVYESKDFRDLAKIGGADYLIIVRLKHYGTLCRYIDLNNYEVEVYAEVKAEMIEAATNIVLWRTGGNEGQFSRTVSATCARPDHTPIILNGLKALLKDAAKETAGQFFPSRLSGMRNRDEVKQ